MMPNDRHITPAAIRALVSDCTALPPHPEDEQNLDPIAIQRMGGPTVQTQATWRSTDRYAWRAVCVHIGRNVRIKRRAYRAWELLRSGLHEVAA